VGDSAGESANLAFYAIVYAKGLVAKGLLDRALGKALEGAALDQVLLEQAALSQPQVDEVLRVRERLGRVCQSCGGTTYLLQDQHEKTTPCEFCGGKLQARGRATSPQRKAKAVAAVQEAARGIDEAAVQQLVEARLAAVGDQVVQKALQAVENRLAQEDLAGFLGHVTEQASQRVLDSITPRVDQMLEQAVEAAARSLAGEVPDAEALVERAAARAVEAVREEAGQAPAGLSEQVTEEVLGRVQDHLAQHDLQGLPDRVGEQVLGQLEPRLGELLEGSSAVAAAEERIRSGVEEQIDALSARVVQRALEAVASKLPDADELTERVLAALAERGGAGGGADEAALATFRDETLATVDARLADVDAKLGELSAAPGGVDEAALAHLRDETLATVDARLADVDAKLGALSAAPGGVDEEALARLRDEVLAAVEARVNGLEAGEAPALDEEALGRIREDVLAEVSRQIPKGEALSPDEVTELATRQGRMAAKDAIGDALDGERERIKEEVLQALFVQDGPPASDAGKVDPEAVTAQAVAAVEERYGLADLAERIAEDVLTRVPAGGGDAAAAAPDPKAVDARVSETATQIVWDQLRPLDLPGLPSRVTDLALKAVHEKLDEELAAVPDNLAQMAAGPLMKSVEKRLDVGSLPDRVAEDVMARLQAQGGLPGGGGGGGEAAPSVDVEAVAEKVIERVETRLAEFDMAAEAVLQDATTQAIDAVEGKIADLRDEGGGGGGGVDVDAITERVAGRVLEQVEARLAGVESGGGAVDPGQVQSLVEAALADMGGQRGGGGVEPEQIRAWVDSAVAERLAGEAPAGGVDPHQIQAWVDSAVGERLAGGAQQPGGGIDAEQVFSWVESAVEERLAVAGGGGVSPADLERIREDATAAARAAADDAVEARMQGATTATTSASGERDRPKGATGVYDRKFIALAREVKQLKDSVKSGGGGSTGKDGRDLLNSEEFQALLEARIEQAVKTGGKAKDANETVALLNSTEFKQHFDTKINQVLAYLKGDLIPSAVKKALSEVESH